MFSEKFYELKDRGVQKIYQVNVHSVLKLDINMCFFFFYYKTAEGNYRFNITRGFPLYWKKQLSKKLIYYLLTLPFYYWFSSNCDFDRLEDRTIKEKILENFILYSPININIREYNI